MSYYIDLPHPIASKVKNALHDGIEQIYKQFVDDCKENNCNLPSIYEFASSFHEFSVHTKMMDEPHLALESFVYAVDLWLFSCSIIRMHEYITCVCLYIAQMCVPSMDITILNSANASIYAYTLRTKEMEMQTFDHHLRALTPVLLIDEEETSTNPPNIGDEIIEFADQIYSVSFSPVSDVETEAYCFLEEKELEPTIPFDAKSYAEIVSVI